jgi:cytoskeleton protein RodZ
MGSVGAYLRELRTRRGVSLEEIARTTRVPQRYLESLEADAYEQLPAPVFIRGFIRAYCQALSESPQEALASYDSREGRLPPPLPRPTPPPRASEGERRSRGTIVVSLVLLVVLGMALFTVALVIQPRDRATNGEARPAPAPAGSPASGPATPPPAATTPPPAAPPPSAVVRPPAAPPPSAVARPPAAAPTPAPPSTPAAPAPAPRTTPPQSSASTEGARTAAASVPAIETLLGSVSAPYRLTARVSDQTWVRVRTEDGRTIEETLAAGEVREWVSDRPLVLTIGNAGGVALELNGRTLPPLGGKGVVIPRLVLPPESR